MVDSTLSDKKCNTAATLQRCITADWCDVRPSLQFEREIVKVVQLIIRLPRTQLMLGILKFREQRK